jgi:hypothetical protein
MQWGNIHKLMADRHLSEGNKIADKKEKLRFLLRKRDEIQHQYNEAHDKLERANAIAPDLVEVRWSLLVALLGF